MTDLPSLRSELSSPGGSLSHLLRFEGAFLSDFSCCGLTLPTLQDLLEHYDEVHAAENRERNGGKQQETKVQPADKVQCQPQTEMQAQIHNDPTSNLTMQKLDLNDLRRDVPYDASNVIRPKNVLRRDDGDASEVSWHQLVPDEFL
jgi:transcription factor SFP1